MSASSRARLFVALELPGEVRATLVDWAERAVAGIAGARLLDPEALHMTLCFLGEVERGAVDGISGVLGEVVGGGGGAGGGAGGAGGPPVFEALQVRWLPARRPRVCAVSLQDLDGRGGALQAVLSARLAAGGWYSPERRGWLAHVTVARISSRGSGGGRPPVGVPPEPPGLGRFAPTAVTLMRSWPGSRYEALTRVAL